MSSAHRLFLSISQDQAPVHIERFDSRSPNWGTTDKQHPFLAKVFRPAITSRVI